ncbi:MAG: hypothetical protein ACRYFK_03890 [Janthinobacterium lividum]
MSFRPLFFALLLSLAAAGTASAQIVIGARIGLGPRYYAPRPRYYAPVVVAPVPYYAPPPVYYAPRPVYYSPRPVYYAPRPYYGRGYYGRRW